LARFLSACAAEHPAAVLSRLAWAVAYCLLQQLDSPFDTISCRRHVRPRTSAFVKVGMSTVRDADMFFLRSPRPCPCTFSVRAEAPISRSSPRALGAIVPGSHITVTGTLRRESSLVYRRGRVVARAESAIGGAFLVSPRRQIGRRVFAFDGDAGYYASDRTTDKALSTIVGSHVLPQHGCVAKATWFPANTNDKSHHETQHSGEQQDQSSTKKPFAYHEPM
jgi:hypothetical protein